MIRTVEVCGPYAELFDWLEVGVAPREAVIEGTAGAGKTHAICEFWRACGERYPDAKFLFLRSTRRSLTDSVLPIWEKVLGPTHPALQTGGTREHRSHYRAQGFAEVVLGGMDSKDKLLSTEYDGIWYNEVNEERNKENWESLNRALRRGKMPFQLLLGDMNPAEPNHPISLRCDRGAAHLLSARVWHNPIAFDATKGEWTDWGVEYLERMASTLTSPVLFKRLFKGERCIAEGAVLDTWDANVHCITGRVERSEHGKFWLYVPDWDKKEGSPWRREIIRMVGGQDFGYSPNPGVAQVWGMDRWGVIYMLAEVYKTKLHPGQWAEVWGRLYKEFPLLDVIVCDHSPGEIEAINSHLRIVQDQLEVPHSKRIPSMARQWSKVRGLGEVKAGIGAIRARLARQVDGMRGLYILNGNLYFGRDETLYEQAKPWRTVDELPGIVVREYNDGAENKEEIVKVNDHGFDVMRGVCLHLRDQSDPEPETKPIIPPDSFNAIIPGFEDEWRKDFGLDEDD